MRTLLLIVVWMLSHVIHLVASTWMLIAAFTGADRGWGIAKLYDFLGNVATGGEVGEYLSTRAYYAMQDKKKWGCVLCKLLDYVQKDHCLISAKIQSHSKESN